MITHPLLWNTIRVQWLALALVLLVVKGGQAATITGASCDNINSNELRFQVAVSDGDFNLDEMTIRWDGSPASLNKVTVAVGNTCDNREATTYHSGDPLSFSGCRLSPGNNPIDIIVKYSPRGQPFSDGQDIALSFIDGTDIYTVSIAKQPYSTGACNITGNESSGGDCVTFLENFSPSSSSQGNTMNWPWGWSEVDDGSNSIQIIEDKLRLEGGGSASNALGGPYIQRELDLSSYTSATVTFNYFKRGRWGSNDYVAIYVSGDGGLHWNLFHRFHDVQGGWSHKFSQPISDYISAHTRIAFVVSAESNRKRFYIDNVKVKACGINAATLDHIRIEHTGVGLTCQRSDIVLRACADADCTSEATEPVTVTMTPSTANPPTWIGGDSSTFTGHQKIQLRHTTPGKVTLGISNPSLTPTNPYICYNSGVAGDCTIDFYQAGFIFTTPDLTACKDSATFSLQAVRSDETTQTCIADAGFANTSQTVHFWSRYIDPDSGSMHLRVKGTEVATTSPGTGIALDFDSRAAAALTLNYPDAGRLQLNAGFYGADAEGHGLIMRGSDTFVSRPAGLCIYSDDPDSDCSAGSASCSSFKTVDEEFNLKVKGVCWQSNRDTDLCSGNPTTPNYAQAGISISHHLVSPTGSGTDSGDISVTSVDIVTADNGEHTINQRVTEVGVFTFSATPPNYFGEALGVATSDYIGRFTPHHFVTSITDHGSLDAACTGFTHTGQPFGYQRSAHPHMVISAVRANGATTVNYRDAFVKLTNPATQISLAGVAQDSSQLGADLTQLLNLHYTPDIGTLSLTPKNNGTLDLVLGDDTFVYTREANALIAPFNSDIHIPISALQDSDGVSATDLPRSFNPAPTEIRYGRMQLSNGYGPETLNLAIPLLTEYYNGKGFIPDTLDSCTSYDAVYISFDNYQNNLAAGETTASGTGILSAGASVITLSAPGTGNDGSVELLYNLDAAGLGWLKPNGNNPSARASFGLYQGNPRLIYTRESIW